MHRLEKTRAFLTEFIIVILFFTISAVITVQFFVKANKKSSDSIAMTQGYLLAESVLEEMKSSLKNGGESGMISYITDERGFEEKNGEYCQYYDMNYKVDSMEKAYILGTVRITESKTKAGKLFSVTVTFESTEKVLSTVSTKLYEEVQ